MTTTEVRAPGATTAGAPSAGRSILADTNRWRATWWSVALLVLVVAVLGSLAFGARNIPFGDVLQAVFDPDGSLDHRAIRDVRLPRTVVGLLAGIAMGLAGALIQALTRNPLADPGILGVNAGAGFALILAVAILDLHSPLAYVWFAFGGAMVATVAVYALGSVGRGGATPERLAVAGIALGSVLGGFGTILTLLHPNAYRTVARWQVATIANPPDEVLAQVAPFLLVGTVLAMALTGPLNAIALGDDVARALGTHVSRARAGGVVAVTLLAGGGTAMAGPVAFVGFVVPHLARRICGPDQRWIFAFTLVIAPTLVLASDVIARLVVQPDELPVGLVTAAVGAPVLIAVVRRRRVVQL